MRGLVAPVLPAVVASSSAQISAEVDWPLICRASIQILTEVSTVEHERVPVLA